MRGVNDDELKDFVALTETKVCYHFIVPWILLVLIVKPIDVRFIEYMPFDGNKWNTKRFVPYNEMLSSLVKHYPTLSRSQDSENDTSKVRNNVTENYYRYIISTIKYLVIAGVWVLSLQ